MATFQRGQMVQVKSHPARVIRFQEIDGDGLAVCCWDDAVGTRQQARFRMDELQPFLRRSSLFKPEVTSRQSERRF
jgi:uncharacterized protein YodC (DUF2158 family)